MSPISRSFVIFLFLCAGLSACTTAAPLSIATPFPTETLTPTVPPPLPTPSLTPEPTATEAPYDVDVETARQRAIIENAPNNIQEFSYLQSDEYLASLREKNANGEFPQISSDAFFVQPGMISLDFDKDPTAFFKKYGVSNAIRFIEYTHKWLYPEDRPWALVDAGYFETGEGFFVVKWKNSDQSEVFWGFEFIPTGTESVQNEFNGRFDNNGKSYPAPGMFFSNEGCKKWLSNWPNPNITKVCESFGGNPDSAIPRDALYQWNSTGILKLDFVPWSYPIPGVKK